MEALFILFVIGLIGVILIGSILGFTSSGRINKLEQQNKNLNARLKVLEVAQGEGQIAAPPKPNPIAVQPPAEQPVAEPVRPKAAPPPVKPVPQPVAAKAAAPAQTFKPAPAAPPKPTRNYEELIGGQWSVWVGGLALLVGAVLLIRFSIEAGFFGPSARIGMAVALGAALLLAGEWLKRADDKVLKGRLGEAAKALQGNASVPGLLSAVGIFTLLGASYAAHELYNLIPALGGFAALAIISLGAMALSLRQGSLLAAIGLLASFATPLLIQTDTPSLLMLVTYLVLIGGAALALSRRTAWGWLATGVVFGWLGWSLMSVEAANSGQLILWSAFLALGFVVTVWFAEADEVSKPEGLETLHLHPIWALVWGAGAAILIIMVGAQSVHYSTGPELPQFILGLASIAALIAASLVFQKQHAHLVTSGLLAVAILLMVKTNFQQAILMASIFAVVLLALYFAYRRGEKGASNTESAWSIFAIALGLGSALMLAIINSSALVNNVPGIIALAYAALFAAVGWWFQRSKMDWTVTVIPVVGAGLGWALAAVLMFEDLHLSLFLSLGAALAALVIWRVRIPGARLVLLGIAGLVFAHALFLQFHDPSALSARPIFNALWAYLALPTAILGGAAYVLHRREADGAFPKFLNGVIEAAALAGLALFAVFQIRHLSNGGVVYANSLGHAELGLQTSIGLCFTLAGLSKRFAGNLVLSKIAEIISYITLAVFGLGSLVVFSPLLARNEDVTGNLIFNSLTTGLLVPTILLGLCAALARGRRPEIYVNVLGGLALAGALSWVTAMIRYLYNGADIHVWSAGFGDMELWTISAVWLAFGITLLALGVWRRERALRIASGIVIILTVLKAFLIDMAGLEGVLRALSFVALGLILIVIGRAYQRYWLSDSTRNQHPHVEGNTAQED